MPLSICSKRRSKNPMNVNWSCVLCRRTMNICCEHPMIEYAPCGLASDFTEKWFPWLPPFHSVAYSEFSISEGEFNKFYKVYNTNYLINIIY